MPKRKIKPGGRIPPDVREDFEQHQRYIEAGQANYARADLALKRILQRCEPGVSHTRESTGRKPPMQLTLVDRFADKNQVWAGTSCKRMKVEATEIKPQDR